MRYVLFTIMAVSLSLAAYAQKKNVKKVIATNDVPDSVSRMQAKLYPGIPVTQWELHAAKKKKSSDHFTAEFKDPNGMSLHTRYDRHGRLRTTSTFYAPDTYPQVVTTALGRYKGYVVTDVEKIVSAKKNKTWYAVKLKRDTGKKTVLLNESGAEIPDVTVKDDDE